MPKNKSSPGEKADFFAFPSRFTILGQVRKNTIPIYLPTKRPRIGTIMKNHIQSSSGLSKAALFVCSESDTSLKNCITIITSGFSIIISPRSLPSQARFPAIKYKYLPPYVSTRSSELSTEYSSTKTAHAPSNSPAS